MDAVGLDNGCIITEHVQHQQKAVVEVCLPSLIYVVVQPVFVLNMHYFGVQLLYGLHYRQIPLWISHVNDWMNHLALAIRMADNVDLTIRLSSLNKLHCLLGKGSYPAKPWWPTGNHYYWFAGHTSPLGTTT